MINLESLSQALCQYKKDNNVSKICISVSRNSTKKVELILNQLLECEPEQKFDKAIAYNSSIARHYRRESKKLLNSIQDGTLEETKVWITALKVFYPNESLLKALKATASLNNLSKAKFLIEEMKVSPHAIIEGTGPLLKFAAGYGNLALVKYLVNVHKVDIEARGEREDTQETALCFAAEGGHYEIAEFLIKNEASTKIRFEAGKGNLLRSAVGSGSLKMVKLLEEKGAYVCDEDGRSWPLQHALEKGNLEIVQYLLQNGANINRVFYEPATYTAATSGNLKLFKYLIEELHLNILVPIEERTVGGVPTGEIPIELPVKKIGSVDIFRYLIKTYNIDVAKYVKYAYIPSETQTISMMRFLFEEKGLRRENFIQLESAEDIEVRAYLSSISDENSEKKEILSKIANHGLKSCELGELKSIYVNDYFSFGYFDRQICLAARHKIVQLYFVRPLLQILETKSNFDIAENICSYLDFSNLGALNDRFFRDPDEIKEFYNRVLLGMPGHVIKQRGMAINIDIRVGLNAFESVITTKIRKIFK